MRLTREQTGQSDGRALNGPVGRRERNKNEKLQRIKAAAREAFISGEFDRVTTRAIATRAGVALGTLFIYATDKRDLLFLAVNDDLDEAVHTAGAAFRDDHTLVDNLLAAFGPLYRYFARNPNFSRLVLREMIFYERGEQAKRFLASRERLIKLFQRIVSQALDRGEIRSKENADFIAWLLFAVCQVEIRHWLSAEKPQLRTGLARLRRALDLFATGLRSAPASHTAKPDRS